MVRHCEERSDEAIQKEGDFTQRREGSGAHCFTDSREGQSSP
jgi:hypothetical protein